MNIAKKLWWMGSSYPPVEDLGIIFTDQFQRGSIGSDYTVTAATVSLDGTKMSVSGAFTSLQAKRIERNFYQALETWKQELTFTLTSTPGAATFGVGLGTYTNSTNSDRVWDVAAYWLPYTGGADINKCTIYLQNRSGSLLKLGTSSGSVAAVVGRSYKATLEKTLGSTGTVYTFTILDNVTLGTTNVSWTEDISIASAATGVYYTHKTANFSTFHTGASVDIYDWTVSSTQKKNCQYLFLTDSIGHGLCASDVANRYQSLLTGITLGVDYQIFAGPSDRLSDLVRAQDCILLYNPRKVFLFNGRNDLSAGTLSWPTNFQTAYSGLVTVLKNAGMEVVHFVPLDAVANRAAFKSWIQATYPGDDLIDASSGMTFSSDNVHPNTAGHALLASVVQGYL